MTQHRLFMTPRLIRKSLFHICAACRQRRSLFQYHGTARADHRHYLCPRCFRSLVNSIRTQ